MNLVVKRSVTIRGHRTSYSLEAPFQDALHAIAGERGVTLAALVGEVDAARPRGANLSSALRIYVLDWVRRGHGGGAQGADPIPGRDQVESSATDRH